MYSVIKTIFICQYYKSRILKQSKNSIEIARLTKADDKKQSKQITENKQDREDLITKTWMKL